MRSDWGVNVACEDKLQIDMVWASIRNEENKGLTAPVGEDCLWGIHMMTCTENRAISCMKGE